MSRRLGLALGLVLCGGLLALSAVGGSAAASGRAGSGGAVEAPATVNSISCVGAGDCAAGGYYLRGVLPYSRRAHRYFREYLRVAFVASETNGHWGKPISVPVPKMASDAEVDSISCAAPGDCAVGGDYMNARFNVRPFVVSETTGTWGKAVAIPGGGDVGVSISCPAVGDCTAGGYYVGRRSSTFRTFVISETNGVWGHESEVPGLPALGANDAEVDSVSCAKAGECVAGGTYSRGYGEGAFVDTEANGVWGQAIAVPGAAKLSGHVALNSISCPAPGECAAVGSYAVGFRTESATNQAFVVNETNGTWGDAIEVPGTAELNRSGDADANVISCPAPGACTAGGYFKDDSGHRRAFVVDETNGTWGSAIEVPGLAAFSRNADVDSLSCATPGECAASGDYKDRRADDDGSYGSAFVASETNGTWSDAIEVPGTASLNGSGSLYYPAASADSVSCGAPGDCVAGGYWISGTDQMPPRERRPRAFVLGETNGTWGNPIRVRARLDRCVVPYVIRIGGAKTTLNGFGCRLGKVTRVSSNKWVGYVVSQEPKPGTILKAGARVALTVSKGGH